MSKFVIIISCFFISCSQQNITSTRDLSTPSRRLVGHWQYENGAHIFFDTINSHTKTGSYIILDTDNTSHYFHYTILAEALDAEELEMTRNWFDVPFLHTTCTVTKDGSNLMIRFRDVDIMGIDKIPSVASKIRNKQTHLKTLEKDMERYRELILDDPEKSPYITSLEIAERDHRELLQQIEALKSREIILRNLDTSTTTLRAQYIDSKTKP